ncbi:unnamed protein product [Toxocara canis]|uniref:Conserved plasma membrane protein n=1 Tax=Toxocara canis TaxID=6265 RepID=A0A183UFN0_TOXCA|nr:unnamed protein product [Toxocara canis]
MVNCLTVVPATFVLNRPDWYKEKMLASGFPVLAVGSAFVVTGTITQICERINERMVPLNRIIVMAIGGLCILAASIVFTIVVIVGNKQDDYAIVRATAVYCWLALFLDIIYIILAVVWPQDETDELISQQPNNVVEQSEHVANNATNVLIDANASNTPTVKGSLRAPRSQQGVRSERSRRGSIRSDKSPRRSERSGVRNVERSRHGVHRSYRSGRSSRRSGKNTGRSRRSRRRSGSGSQHSEDRREAAVAGRM